MVSEKTNKKFSKPKKDYSDLMESPYVAKWINSYTTGQQSRLSVLNNYCIFLNKTPEEILLEHHKDVIQPMPLDITNIGTNQLLAYFEYLIGNKNNINNKMINKTVSYNSARQYVFSKMPSFFRKNNVKITFQKGDVPGEIDGVKELIWRNGTKMVGKDEKKECIKTIKDNFDSKRNKAILLCKTSSAMDDVELFNLKVKDFIKGYFDDFNLCYLSGVRQKIKKKGIKFQTFFNGEACDWLNLYLKEREQRKYNQLVNKAEKELTETEKEELKLKSKLKKEDWLFVSEKNINRKILSNAFADNLTKVCEKLDLHNITPKSFRRYFKTELRKHRIDDGIIKRMMGQKTDVGTKYDYMFMKGAEEELAEFYSEEIEPLIQIGNGVKKGETNKKLEKLEEELYAMKNLYDEEMLKLRTEMAEMMKELGYRKDLNDKVKEGKISEGEARAEYQGIELTEDEKHSKFVRKPKIK